MNHVKLQWGNTLKYIGCLFQINSCRVDIRQQLRKYHGNFNNIMSVYGKGRNEIAAVQLIKCYCVPVLTYACEIWQLVSHLSSAEYHKVDVL